MTQDRNEQLASLVRGLADQRSALGADDIATERQELGRKAADRLSLNEWRLTPQNLTLSGLNVELTNPKMPVTDALLDMQSHGAERLHGAVASDLAPLRAAFAHLPSDHAGIRIREVEGLASFLAPTGSIGEIAARTLGQSSFAVRAILFDKTERTNWSLAWHQDRTICVERRVEVDNFGPWTVKAGMQHVAPPFTLLSRMVTLRVHLDDVPASNAPLLIAPGSHNRGRVPVEAIDDVVRQCGTYACLADAGDVWAYSTPILHASEAAVVPVRRRVLQVDYASEDLPGGLAWLGV